MSSWGRSIALAIGLALATATPAFAQPEIEMEPEETKPPDPKPPDAKPEPKKDPKPAPPPQPPKPPDKPAGEIEIDPETPPAPAAVVKDPKLAKKVAATAQQAAFKGDQLVRQKKPEEAKPQYEQAIVGYLKAIELGDDPNLYYDLAIVEEKIGKLADAATHWRAVTKATAGVRPDVLKKSTAKYDEMTAKVGLLTLVVKPEGATISLDNVELGKAPLALPLILMPGTYNFQLAAEGHQLKSVEVKVEAGSESERGIDLEPIKIVIETKPPIEIDETPVAPPKPPTRLPLFIGAGATGAFLVATTITGLVAVGKHGTFTGAETENFDRELARYDGKNFARASDIFLVATLAAGGFTAYWYFFKYKPAQRKFSPEKAPMPRKGADEPQRAKAVLAPWVQPDGGAGVSLGGRF